MKTLIASALILTAGFAQAHSFEHERQIGSSELYPTLISTGHARLAAPGQSNFDYQLAVGSPDLFPTLISAGVEPQPASGQTAFDYQIAVGSPELDPSLS